MERERKERKMKGTGGSFVALLLIFLRCYTFNPLLITWKIEPEVLGKVLALTIAVWRKFAKFLKGVHDFGVT